MDSLIKRILGSRSKISTQLYAGFFGAVALTLVASLVAWFSFNRIEDAQDRVNDQVPNMESVFELAVGADALAAAAPRLMSSADQKELGSVSAQIADERRQFVVELSEAGADSANLAVPIRKAGEELIENIVAIETSVATRLLLAEQRARIVGEATAIGDRLVAALIPAIDDQLFYTMTGYRRLGAPPDSRAQRLSEREVNRYRLLADLYADATMAIQLLASVSDLDDRARLGPLRERFDATTESIARALTGMRDSPLYDQLSPDLARLRTLGAGATGGITLRFDELVATEAEAELLQANRRLVAELGSQARSLVADAGSRVRGATSAADASIGTGKTLLIVINAISFGGAVLLTWLLVGRTLIRRLEHLSERMQAMANGDLEGKIDTRGKDEVAKMAEALEVFRDHAREVLRLNVVEKQAREISEKNEQLEAQKQKLESTNEELESTLEQLSAAQGQIVAKEKLAALGELTAGVAHEIRNPLNFVKNFSEASQELVQELDEELAEAGEGMEDGQLSFIKEICGDLTENMDRIRHHGGRADRIVHDMLKMGSGSAGEKQATDLNALIDEHVRLAFHSARAKDSDFQLDIKQNLDPEVGTVDVIPQDLGRVFINIVTNAGYAADERRKKPETSSDYEPTVEVTSKRDGDQVTVTIRDNGTGIPDEVLEKIFNPFFTTKPTDQGTGLGLAICNDIVREHGGEIVVTTEPGNFTQMVVSLPAPQKAAA